MVFKRFEDGRPYPTAAFGSARSGAEPGLATRSRDQVGGAMTRYSVIAATERSSASAGATLRWSQALATGRVKPAWPRRRDAVEELPDLPPGQAEVLGRDDTVELA